MTKGRQEYVLYIDETFNGLPEVPNSAGMIIASNGTFRFAQAYLRNVPFFTVISRNGQPLVSKGSQYGPFDERFDLHIGRIPLTLIDPVESFFSWVYDQYQAEAQVNLYYAPDTQSWLADAPEQLVSHAEVETDAMPAPRGHLLAGTIHSHANFRAFYSGVDDHNDLDNGAGIHIVIGNINEPQHSYSGSVVFGNIRHRVPLYTIVEPRARADFPDAWKRRVTLNTQRQWTPQSEGGLYGYTQQ